ncbi:lysylphosphatidylglycerol synthase transmembrane domain-containing protein [Chryseobacterium sp.]|uniref:lysylphosphatidylglycerol synthase transmembrane domain-containing protein n=1 Tax=Chryseobacterium sp. TaxID=1871047 RepID=UPI001627B911|nr:lysylphosphatidylglycerol synthase transmembrane domain-containing protein [Chryseobacterium sp.]
MEKSRLKKILLNSVKIGVSLALLYFVFKKIPFSEVGEVLQKVHVFWLILAAVFFLASQVLSAKRLELFLKTREFHLSFRSNLELYFLGMFYNFFIPGGIGGDAYKIYLLHKKFGWSAKTLTSALFNDRLSGLLAICVLILLFSATLFQLQWTVLFLLAAATGILLTFFITKRYFTTFQPVFWKGFGVSLLIQMLQMLCFVFLLKSMGIGSHYIIYSIVFLASSVLSLISFAGIGVREMLFLQASHYFSFDPTVSVSASLLFTLITAVFSLFGWLFQLRKLNLKLTEES